jgi:hypothetical protein
VECLLFSAEVSEHGWEFLKFLMPLERLCIVAVEKKGKEKFEQKAFIYSA